MKGLLVKDYYLIFQRKQTLILFAFLCVFISFTTGGSFVIGYMTFLSAVIATSTISYDEFDNGLLFLMTLPAERKTYALSKYVLCGTLCLGGWSAANIFTAVTSLFKDEAYMIIDNLESGIVLFPMVFLLMDVMIPVQLKYGSEKSRIILMVLGGSMAALGLVIMKSPADAMALDAFVESASQVPGWIYAAALIIVFIAATAGSIYASIKVMEHKSF